MRKFYKKNPSVQTCWMNWKKIFFLFILTNFGFSGLNAQVSGYNFTKSSATYTEITGGSVIATATANTSAGSLDSALYPITIPFGFTFDGQSYTSFNVSTNGYIVFGTTLPTTTTTSIISSTTAFSGAISAWGRDINSVFDLAGQTGEMRWETLGTAPNREVVIQWKNFRPTYSVSTTAAYTFSFQIRLKETTNEISMVYTTGAYTLGSTTYNSTAQIGLRGSSNADFNNRLNATTVKFDESTPGTLNSNTQSFNTLTIPPGMPSNGLTYTWTPPTCVAPTGVNITNITGTTASVNWTASSTPPTNGYDIYYSTSSTVPTSTSTPNVSNVTGLTSTITGLSPGTIYYVWVRSNCSATDQSVWTPTSVVFNTLCTPISYMFENFDLFATGNIVPTCWTRIAPTTTPGSQTISSTTPASGTRNIYQYATVTQSPVVVALPEFSNINAATNWIRFKARVSTAPGLLDVGYVTNLTDPTSFVSLQTITITNTTYTVPEAEYTVAVPNSVPANARIAIRNTADGKSYYWDDVYWEPVPSCYKPTYLVVTGATNSTINLSWTAPPVAPANGYEYYYSTTNTPPDATTTALGTSSSTTATISGLSADTVYYIWVRALCTATDKSEWSLVTSGITAYCVPTAGATSTTYYINSITLTNSYPTSSDIAYTASSYTAYVNNTSTILSNYASGAFNYVITGSSANPKYFYIWVDWNQDLDFNDAGETILTSTSSMLNATGSFNIPLGTPNGSYRVRFGMNFSTTTTSCGSANYGNFVDYTLNIVSPPSCVPPSNLSVSNISYNTADISWIASVTPPTNGYEVYFSTSNTAPTSATTPNVSGINALSTTITGLTPITKYYVWVRSNCATADQSIWINVPISFYTLCQPPAILSTTPATACSGNTISLSATADSGATITWYDAASAGNIVGTGGTFTTPALTATTNYWVTASNNSNISYVGKNIPTSTTGNTGFTGVGLVFNAMSNFIIETVDVYPVSSTSTSGTVSIDLKDSAGVTLQTITANVNVSATGVLNTVPLNFSVTPGNNYRLVVTGVTGITSLIREITTGFTYPYTMAGVCSITSAYTGAAVSSAYYYYLYNWKVRSACESGRTAVTATIDSGCLGTSETENEKGITVYPNPFTDILNISDIKDVKSIDVLDMSGRFLKTIKEPSSRVNLSELKSGMYLINLYLNDGTKKTIKIIKK